MYDVRAVYCVRRQHIHSSRTTHRLDLDVLSRHQPVESMRGGTSDVLAELARAWLGYCHYRKQPGMAAPDCQPPQRIRITMRHRILRLLMIDPKAGRIGGMTQRS